MLIKRTTVPVLSWIACLFMQRAQRWQLPLFVCQKLLCKKCIVSFTFQTLNLSSVEKFRTIWFCFMVISLLSRTILINLISTEMCPTVMITLYKIYIGFYPQINGHWSLQAYLRCFFGLYFCVYLLLCASLKSENDRYLPYTACVYCACFSTPIE